VGARILVVEDELAIQQLLALTLKSAGHEPTLVGNAEEALSCINAELPDLIVLDWMLPGRSGIALARQLRNEARTRSLPIIMLTARAQEADKVAGLETGADDYITKPFSQRELVARVKALLRRHAPDAGDEPVCSWTLPRAGSLATAPKSLWAPPNFACCISL
jgi:two-component system, OmpR family, phosphate regulon response regulator PhoB